MLIAAVLTCALAQASPDWTVLIGQFGIAGILAFVLVKLEPRLKGIEDALNTLARSNLLVVVALRKADEVMKESAREEIRKIDAKYPRTPTNEP